MNDGSDCADCGTRFGSMIIATLEGDKVEVRFGQQTKRLLRSILATFEP
jgi:hypothetical protein